MTAAKHRYPSHYPPGSHWSIDEAWRILDRLPVGLLPDDYRFLLSGMIAGALMKAVEERAPDGESAGSQPKSE